MLDRFMQEVMNFDGKWFREIGGYEALAEIERLRHPQGYKSLNDIKAELFPNKTLDELERQDEDPDEPEPDYDAIRRGELVPPTDPSDDDPI